MRREIQWCVIVGLSAALIACGGEDLDPAGESDVAVTGADASFVSDVVTPPADTSTGTTPERDGGAVQLT